uniref:Uncharacterized protein n=1 Tax=Candidatus Kentrum sp. LFY TaxID=2126342 RepID=A0A450ULZ5_9GAMM|nr:MAG: hypothetical protein BECKLFY1418B_GA0070995_104719 [Candidatus Kentron sp. LFY]
MMNKLTLLKKLKEKMLEFKLMPYDTLVKYVGKTFTYQSGKEEDFYQIEIMFFFDDREKQNVRVAGAIDDGGWRSFFPLGESFIVQKV